MNAAAGQLRASPRWRPARAGAAALARAAAGPVICGAAVIGLLSVWVATGGAGPLSREQLQITLAAVPMRSYTPVIADTIGTAGTYLTIRNLTGRADELVAVRSPVAAYATLAQRTALGASPTTVGTLTIPAHGTITLTPVTDDVILHNPAPFESRTAVPLILVFRHAGQITIDALVTIPGTA